LIGVGQEFAIRCLQLIRQALHFAPGLAFAHRRRMRKTLLAWPPGKASKASNVGK
jgi:hypothetical protein